MRVLITGGTGSLGRALIQRWHTRPDITWLGCFSRDEAKQDDFEAELGPAAHTVRFLLGDVRNPERLRQAMRGIDLVVHAAALKRIHKVAYAPEEALWTNVLGTYNVIEAAIQAHTTRVLIISTDKAVLPSTLYGMSKGFAEALAIAANARAVPAGTKVSCVRYANVLGSRGSVTHVFQAAKATGTPFPITHPDVTRFWITMPWALDFIDDALRVMAGGEIFVPVLPSLRVTDLARAVDAQYPQRIIGWRDGGEKLHEQLLTPDEIPRTVALGAEALYLIQPSRVSWRSQPYPGTPIDRTFCYRSDTNRWWLSVDEMRALLAPHA